MHLGKSSIGLNSKSRYDTVYAQINMNIVHNYFDTIGNGASILTQGNFGAFSCKNLTGNY